jgi:hypothetical protein
VCCHHFGRLHLWYLDWPQDDIMHLPCSIDNKSTVNILLPTVLTSKYSKIHSNYYNKTELALASVNITFVIWATEFHLQKKLDLLAHNGREGIILLNHQPETSIDTPEGRHITILDHYVNGWWTSEIMMAVDFGDYR